MTLRPIRQAHGGQAQGGVSRRRGREFTMQVLYASEVGGEVLENASDVLSGGDPALPLEMKQYGLQLARTVRMRAGEIDRIISGISDHWDLSRLAVVDRIILRMAIAELISEPDVPSKVCINEAVEIARKFSTENSSRFVNGILDAVARQLQNPPEPTSSKFETTESA